MVEPIVSRRSLNFQSIMQTKTKNTDTKRSRIIRSREHNALPLILFRVTNLILLILFGIIGILHAILQYCKDIIMDKVCKTDNRALWERALVKWLSAMNREETTPQELSVLHREFMSFIAKCEDLSDKNLTRESLYYMDIILLLLDKLWEEMDKMDEMTEGSESDDIFAREPFKDRRYSI